VTPKGTAIPIIIKEKKELLNIYILLKENIKN
jgi:hypothetical protein